MLITAVRCAGAHVRRERVGRRPAPVGGDDVGRALVAALPPHAVRPPNEQRQTAGEHARPPAQRKITSSRSRAPGIGQAPARGPGGSAACRR